MWTSYFPAFLSVYLKIIKDLGSRRDFLSELGTVGDGNMSDQLWGDKGNGESTERDYWVGGGAYFGVR